MRVEVTRSAESERPVLANLLSLYLHDWSEVLGGVPGPDGRFTYDRLPLYFEDPARVPFLVRADGELAGLALVTRGSVISGAPDVLDLSEFFVVRGLRRRGVGCAAASAVFRAFTGPWEVRALDRNPGAAGFWAAALSAHTGGAFETGAWEPEPGRTWKVFRFVQRGGGPAAAPGRPGS